MASETISVYFEPLARELWSAVWAILLKNITSKLNFIVACVSALHPSNSRAHPVSAESGCALDSCIAACPYRKTGVHFSGTCASIREQSVDVIGHRASALPNKSFLRAILVQTLCALFVIVPNLGMATTNVLSPDGQFVIAHDFANIVIGEQQQRSVHAFIDVKTFAVDNSPLADQDKLRALANHLLGDRVQLITKKDDANLFIQILMYQTINYAIRNLDRQPAKGFILVSVCKYPITQVGTDCENQTYFYFADYKPADVFERVFAMWLDSVLPRLAR